MNFKTFLRRLFWPLKESVVSPTNESGRYGGGEEASVTINLQQMAANPTPRKNNVHDDKIHIFICCTVSFLFFFAVALFFVVYIYDVKLAVGPILYCVVFGICTTCNYCFIRTFYCKNHTSRKDGIAKFIIEPTGEKRKKWGSHNCLSYQKCRCSKTCCIHMLVQHILWAGSDQPPAQRVSYPSLRRSLMNRKVSTAMIKRHTTTAPMMMGITRLL